MWETKVKGHISNPLPASEMTCLVSVAMLNFAHSLTQIHWTVHILQSLTIDTTQKAKKARRPSRYLTNSTVHWKLVRYISTYSDAIYIFCKDEGVTNPIQDRIGANHVCKHLQHLQTNGTSRTLSGRNNKTHFIDILLLKLSVRNSIFLVGLYQQIVGCIKWHSLDLFFLLLLHDGYM